MRILIVEDETKVAHVVQRALEELQLTADFAITGEEAMQRVRDTAYDLLVLDVMLPDTSGFDLCREVRSVGSRFPILMLSARSHVEDRVQGLDAGADDYLAKPFDPTELVARVRALFRRHREPTLLPLSVGDLSLDPLTRVVQRGLRHVELTPKEFALLEYLMRHAGQPLTRQMISEQVWGFTWDRLTNVIDVFINHLRGKIEGPGARKLIHAVRGVGYVIREPEADD